MSLTLKTINHVSAWCACAAVLVVAVYGGLEVKGMVSVAVIAAYVLFWAVPVWLLSTVALIVKGAAHGR